MNPSPPNPLEAAGPYIEYYHQNDCLPTTAPNVQALLQNAYYVINNSLIDFSCGECIRQGMHNLVRHWTAYKADKPAAPIDKQKTKNHGRQKK